ncbi:MAG: hypothetical protein C4521_12210 [Actinobacteria bacterium]|nr:MAG: hypothetical protein C4521_12210 [Actinomycetota bacterium]
MYPVTAGQTPDPAFPEYRLQENPFKGAVMADRKKTDALMSFWSAAAQKEAARLWWKVLEQARSEEPEQLWFLRDPNSVGSSNIETLAALMRRICTDSQAGLLGLYLPLPLAHDDLLGTILRVLVDRIVPTDFRKCFYAYASLAVAAAAQDSSLGEQLSTFDDLAELSEKLADAKRSGIHSFLFPNKETRVKETHALRKAKLDDEDEEKKAELLAERERIVKLREQRDQLRSFLERRLHREDWGEGVKLAMRQVFESSAFVQAREPLISPADYRTNLAGLFKFLRHRFAKTVVFVDQVEAFGGFNESEKAAFYGGLAEFAPIAGQNAMWMFAGFPETVEAIGSRRLAMFETIPIELGITREVTKAPIPVEIFSKLVGQFLSTDPLRAEGGKGDDNALFPFTSSCIEKVFAEEEGDSFASITRLYHLLEEGRREGKAEIDDPILLLAD